MLTAKEATKMSNTIMKAERRAMADDLAIILDGRIRENINRGKRSAGLTKHEYGTLDLPTIALIRSKLCDMGYTVHSDHEKFYVTWP